MPLPNNRKPLPPNTSPSGRSIHPDTARIMAMPGGLDYLAGFGPPPPGIVDTNIAPVIKHAVLGPTARPPENFSQTIARWAASQSPWQQNAASWYGSNPYSAPTPWSAKAGMPAVGQSVGTAWRNQTPVPPPAPVAMPVKPQLPYGGFGTPGLIYGGGSYTSRFR